jgi:tetratricopeptide (TPR) repeat protein
LFPGTYLYDLYKTRTGATDDIWLYREEDLPFFEADTNLPAETVSQYGNKMKQALQESIPDFIHSLELVDDEELFPFHASFLSRLALTIDRGDYPHALPEGTAQDLALELYSKALEYAPDAQAYWGLGLLAQDMGDYQKAEAILQEGMRVFPKDDMLAKVLADTLMRLGTEEEARRLMRHQ